MKRENSRMPKAGRAFSTWVFIASASCLFFSLSVLPSHLASDTMCLDDWPEARLTFCQQYQKIVVAKFVAEADDFWHAPARRGNVFKKEFNMG